MSKTNKEDIRIVTRKPKNSYLDTEQEEELEEQRREKQKQKLYQKKTLQQKGKSLSKSSEKDRKKFNKKKESQENGLKGCFYFIFPCFRRKTILLTQLLGQRKNKVVAGSKTKKKVTRSIPTFNRVKKKRFSKKIEDTMMFEKAIFNLFKKSIPENQVDEYINYANPIDKDAKQYLTEKRTTEDLKKPRKLIQLPTQSQASVIWNNRTLKKVFYLILVMNGGLVLFTSSFYTSTSRGFDMELKNMADLYQMSSDKKLVKKYIDNLIETYRKKDLLLIRLKFSDGFIDYENDSKHKLQIYRDEELFFQTYIDEKTGLKIQLILSNKIWVQLETILKLCSIFYVVLNMLGAYYYLSKVSSNIIMKPLEHIVKIMNCLLYRPIDPNVNVVYLKKITNKLKLAYFNEEEWNTITLGLMRIFFWSSCAFGSNTLGLVTNSLVFESKQITEMGGDRFYGFMALLEVIDMYDTLDGKGNLIYINQLFDIVYRTGDRYLADSHFIGDNKFIVIWKLDAADSFSRKEASRNQSEAASLSVTTILKTIRKIDLLRKQSGFKHKDYAGYMRATLHAGSIVESLTGTYLKLDITHMSPEISFIHNLHDKIEQYQTPFVMSGRVYDIIPECMKFHCRMVDVIKFSYSTRAQNIYCMDITNAKFKKEDFESSKQLNLGTYEKRRLHMRMRSIIIEKLNQGAKNALFLEDGDLANMFDRDNEFRRNYRKAINFYILGAWNSAKEFFDVCLKIKPKDGPSKVLLSYMEGFGFMKPPNWRGYNRMYKLNRKAKG